MSLSHGNAVPERGFSVNKKILDVHGYPTSELTINSLRTVKDYIHHYGTANKFPIPVALLDFCKDAKAKYNAALEKEKAQREAGAKRHKEDEQRIAEKQKHDDSLKDVEKKINDNMKINVAGNLIEEASIELQSVTSSDKSNIKTNSLVPITEKMNLGIGRKRQLEEKLRPLLSLKEELFSKKKK